MEATGRDGRPTELSLGCGLWAVGWAATGLALAASRAPSQWAGGGLEAIAAVDGSGAREIGTGSLGVVCSLQLSSGVFDPGVVKPASSPESRPACPMLVLGYRGTWRPTCGVVGCWCALQSSRAMSATCHRAWGVWVLWEPRQRSLASRPGASWAPGESQPYWHAPTTGSYRWG